MALSLNLSIQERNDNSALVITDTSTTDTSTGWGVGGNVDYTDIEGTVYNLLLDIIITTSDNVETVYDTIDLYATFSPFTTYDDLVFTITPLMLLENSVCNFTAEDVMPDGIYDITYALTSTGTDGTSTEVMKLVNGVVTNGCYELLRANNTSYDDSLLRDDRKTREAMFAYSYLIGMKASEFSVKREELLTQLFTLERLITDGSNNAW